MEPVLQLLQCELKHIQGLCFLYSELLEEINLRPGLRKGGRVGQRNEDDKCDI